MPYKVQFCRFDTYETIPTNILTNTLTIMKHIRRTVQYLVLLKGLAKTVIGQEFYYLSLSKMYVHTIELRLTMLYLDCSSNTRKKRNVSIEVEKTTEGWPQLITEPWQKNVIRHVFTAISLILERIIRPKWLLRLWRHLFTIRCGCNQKFSWLKYHN